MFNWILTAIILLAIILAVVGAIKRIRLWHAGQADAASSVSFIAGLAAIPRRYLVDLHHVVARDKYMSNTHVAVGGGFVLSLVLIVCVFVFATDLPVLHWALAASSLLMFAGALSVFIRRQQPPARLSKGPWMRLPLSQMLFSSCFFCTVPPIHTAILTHVFAQSMLLSGIFNGVLLVGITIGLAEMLFGMTWGGPMKHAFAGALHLGFHRRAERFNGGRSTALKTVNLDADTLGVAKPSDFKWNQLLGFDACVQCGRCENVCPAFAAGQPLNPKKLIQDMVIGLAGGDDSQYAGSHHPSKASGGACGGPDKIITQGLISQETLWSCTTCRACVEECPMMIEHVDAIVDMRRYLTLEKGATPNKGAEVLDNLIATDNPNGLNPQSRMHWAADQNLRLMQDVKSVDVLFWVSDGAFDMRSQGILRAFVKLLNAANVDFAVLGNEELDCGDIARRLGDDATFQRLAKVNCQTLSKYKFNKIVTTDPHAFHILKNEYSEFIQGDVEDNVEDGFKGNVEGKSYEVYHHTTFLNELIKAGKLTVESNVKSQVTYHDPCYLGRYNGEYESPRALLAALGIDVAEMTRSGYRSRCCGGGGGAPITDIPGEQRIADMRMDDIRETGAEIVAVGCQQCTAMLEGVVEPRPQVMDVAELLAENIVLVENLILSEAT